MKVAALTVGGDAATWRRLGFDAGEDGGLMLGPVRLELSVAAKRGTIASWTLEGTDIPASIDGLATRAGQRHEPGPNHPNGAAAIDHIVVLTPSLDRTTAAFGKVGVERRRVRDAGGGVRQGFFLVADVLVEVVEGTGLGAEEPARFWGITAVVSDIDSAAELLGDSLGSVKAAVQPGRRIATVRPEAVGGLPLALITPR
ncbi:MAG: VOC family protein [Actinomycetota bacterium]|nr:VOC family protein [Actinomycetota bacterium]